ncbi:ScbR family autoregulator-binding transcription factor [Mycobacterium sp. GA-2829]|uniref:ScbR family autoregulator-binding transcription factor n=1 Tax=Mycobacterium sp. GA-2829 TaxID=1772283 RepID=UPI0007403E57|nr:ScbR family autoregulator-binding transcription factor [Mycobacterium sp. GA-2829]KUI27608.1 TetR family transcriptional regulator [Mycobacterium sp. GA-2829]
MIRQARSEATRRRIIEAAVDLFSERGYPGTGLGDIIERAEMTKGALYYHFDSKEALAAEIVAEGSARLRSTFDAISETSSPALESIIHGTFVVVDQLRTDRVARVGIMLMRVFAGFSESARGTYSGWLAAMAADVERARDEGDVRDDVDVVAVAETFVGSFVGGSLLADAASGGTDLRDRVTRMFALVLPAIVTDDSREYFAEFLTRETLRRPRPD